MKKILIGILLFSLILIIGCQERDPHWLAAQELLENESKPITLTQETIELDLPTEVLRNNEIFLTGEIHGYERNEALRFAFLKYFKEQTNFKYYLNELSYSGAYFLNQYLKTGNEAILDKLYAHYEGTFEWNKDNYNHWKKVYELNKKLAEEDKIKVVGIDLEHQYPIAFEYLQEMIDQHHINSDNNFNSLLTLVNNHDEMSRDEIYRQTNNLLTIIEENKNTWQSAFEDDYFGVKMVIDNIIYKHQASSYEDINDFNRFRDSQMYQNFESIDYEINHGTHFSNDKYFGQWGYAHVFQEEIDGIKYLAGYMEDYSKYEGQVLSIGYIYEGSTQMTKNKGAYKNITHTYINDRFESIVKDIPGETIFFNTNIYDSVFHNELIWPYRYLKPKKLSTLDYFEYLVLIRNSGPTEPLEAQK